MVLGGPLLEDIAEFLLDLRTMYDALTARAHTMQRYLQQAIARAHRNGVSIALFYVDLDRFMGDWYVIANIPTAIETEAYNAIESYRLDDDGTIKHFRVDMKLTFVLEE